MYPSYWSADLAAQVTGLTGFGAWGVDVANERREREDGLVDPFFGIQRDGLEPWRRRWRSVPRWRWWLGYKLYAVVYWLLRGHA